MVSYPSVFNVFWLKEPSGDSIPALDEMTPDRHDRKTYERLFPGSRPSTGIVPGQRARAATILEK